jgi:hypothetical protein
MPNKFRFYANKENKQQQECQTRFEEARTKNTEKLRSIRRHAAYRYKRERTMRAANIKWMYLFLTLLLMGGYAAEVTANILRNRHYDFEYDDVLDITNTPATDSDNNALTNFFTETHASQNRNLHDSFRHDQNDVFFSNNVTDIQEKNYPITQLTKTNIGDVKILDFWGEGRIVEGNLVTGFSNAYNVNHQHQKISNGANRGGVIPNRIPTVDYDNVNISTQVADNTFQYVTLMGAPLIHAAAQEMYRVIKKDDASRILCYGVNGADLVTIQNALQDDFIYMQRSEQYVKNLEFELLEVSIRPIHLMVPINQVLKDLKQYLMSNNIFFFVRVLQDLETYCRAGYAKVDAIVSYVTTLIREYGDPVVLAQSIVEQVGQEQADQINTLFVTPARNLALR